MMMTFTRSSISRLKRRGMLAAERRAGSAGYALTPAAKNPAEHPEWWGKTFYKHFPRKDDLVVAAGQAGERIVPAALAGSVTTTRWAAAARH